VNNPKITQAIRDADHRGDSSLDLRDIEFDPDSRIVSEFQRFTSIRVGGLKLQHIPKAICRLNHMDALYIDNCSVNSLPEEIGDLANLECLWITKCRNLKELPKSIGRLQRLGMLLVNENGIESIPSMIGNLKNLRRLVLEGNRLNDLPPTFSELKVIELNLKGNLFKEVPDEVLGMQNLITLNLAFNQIQFNPLDDRGFAKVSWLSLSGNRLRLLPELAVWESVVDLDLSFNRFEVIPASVYRLPRLRTLNLVGNAQIGKDALDLFEREALSAKNGCLRNVTIDY
jgi:Leucine-rich repeat (LRR) protein